MTKCTVYCRRLILSCLVLAALVLLALRVHAGDNEWTSVGPFGLHLANTLVFDPQTSDIIYLLSGDGLGLYRSTDGGASWSLANKGLPINPNGFLQVITLAVDPQASSIVYASVSGFGIYKSTDRGDSWSSANRGLPDEPGGALYVYALAVDPKTPSILYAGAGDFGVYKSTDGGGSWSSANTGLPIGLGGFLYVNSLVVDPKTPAILYARVSEGDIYDSTDAIYKSANGGASWSPANEGLPTGPSGILYVNALTVDPKTPGTVYATKAGTGIYKSTDGGASWYPANKGLPTESSGIPYVNALTVDPETPAMVYASVGVFGIYKSIDGAASWFPVNKGLPVHPFDQLPVHALVLDPETPTTLYVTVGGSPQLYHSTDGGQSWSPAPFAGIQGLPVSSLAVSPRDADLLYASVRGDGIHRSLDGGTSWQNVGSPEPGTDIRSLAVDPHKPSTVLAAVESGLFRSGDRGDTWQPYATDLPPEAGDFIVFDPQAPATLYVSGPLGIYKTVDDGDIWFQPNGGLPRDGESHMASPTDIMAASIDLPTDEDIYGFPALRGFVINPQAPARLYTIVSGHGVYRSVDSGESWQAANNGLPVSTDLRYGPSPEFFELTIDAQAPHNLYVAVMIYDDPDCTDCTYLYKSTDGAESWSRLPFSLTPSDADPYPRLASLAVDSRTASLLYVVTNSQFLYSVDGGQSWYTFGQELPAQPGNSSAILASSPAEPGRVFLAGERGVYTANLSATLTLDVITLGTPPVEDWVFSDSGGQFTLPAAGGKKEYGRRPVGVNRVEMVPQPNFTPRSWCTYGSGTSTAREAHLVAGSDVHCQFFNIGDDASHVFLPALGH